MKTKTLTLSLALSSVALAAVLFGRAARAEGNAAGPRDPEIEREVRSVRIWGAAGVLLPLTGALAISMATNSPDREVSRPVSLAMDGLVATGGLWGTSMAYYRAGLPTYATLSGLGKTALLAGGLLADTRLPLGGNANAERGYEGFPIFTSLGLAAVVGWDLYDYFRLGRVVREETHRSETHPVALVPVATSGGAAFSLAGTF